MIEHIDAESPGLYVVRTQGSEHVWNPQEGWYVRKPGRRGHWSMSDFPNHRRVHWTRVERWPVVGQTFRVILTGDTPWHQSSTIREIEEVVPE